MKPFCFFALIFFLSPAQLLKAQSVASGVFGASSEQASSTNKWIKFGQLTLNGNYSSAGIFIQFFPRNSNHGDSHQEISALFRNSNGTGLEPTYDLTLIDYSGAQRSINDVKVVHVSGSGVTNNVLSLWIQMGTSWVSGIPFEIRYYGNVSFETTNQPFYSAITEPGQVYEKKSSYGMQGSTFRMDARFHMKTEPAGIKSEFGTLMIEGTDAQLDIISKPDGQWGSAINFVEGNGSSNTDIWSLTRQTTGGTGNSSLNFNYGAQNRHNNPTLFTICHTGDVGIGTTAPDSKLTVKGVIHAQEVKVDLNVPGPDYVFDADYPLTSLEDTKAYIDQHKHLPGIPSSAEMQLNGVNLLEMNMKLLEKVEELVLYQLQLLQKIEAQDQRIYRLENKEQLPPENK